MKLLLCAALLLIVAPLSIHGVSVDVHTQQGHFKKLTIFMTHLASKQVMTFFQKPALRQIEL